MAVAPAKEQAASQSRLTHPACESEHPQTCTLVRGDKDAARTERHPVNGRLSRSAGLFPGVLGVRRRRCAVRKRANVRSWRHRDPGRSVVARLRDKRHHRTAQAANASLPLLPRLLDQWTWRVGIGAEHAAITRFGLEQNATVFALIEKLTGVRRHGFRGRMLAMWARDGGPELHPDYRASLSRTESKYGFQASARPTKNVPADRTISEVMEVAGVHVAF